MAELDSVTFPTRPECFGSDPLNSTCTIPSPSMIDFLNITNPDVYMQMYCTNPPTDSCAFGYCPNPDIASPAVRSATYTSTVCLAILILYNPDVITQSFYTQLLQIYALMIAAIVSIGLRQLSRLHAVFALTAAGSPLSLYLFCHALRSLFTASKSKARLHAVFGPSASGDDPMKHFNRAAVVLGLPTWTTILVFISRPSGAGWFQQTACDAVFNHDLVRHFFYGPAFLFMRRTMRTRILVLTPIAVLVLAWIVALILQRHAINNQNLHVGIIRRIWRAVTDRYPFIRFCTVIFLPFAIWIAMLESGALFSNEHFTPTYGQVLAIAAAIPPLVQCFYLFPRLRLWIVDLTWVRIITGRQNAPYQADYSKPAPGSYEDVHGGPSNCMITKTGYDKLDEHNLIASESLDAGVRLGSGLTHTRDSSSATDSTFIQLNFLGGVDLHFDTVPSSHSETVTHSSAAVRASASGRSPSNAYGSDGSAQRPPRVFIGSNLGGARTHVDPFEPPARV